MKKTRSIDPRTVSAKKDLPAVINNFFAENIPQLGGPITREPVVREIIKIFDTYCPPTERMKAGQVLWYAVDKNETAGYGKRLEECQLKPVTLDLVHREDIERIKAGMKRRDRAILASVRLFDQTYKQGAVLTLADAASVMRLTPATVGKYIRDYERTHNTVVPRRGTIHDMGPSITHKRIICFKHMVEGKSVEVTARETRHSVAAVTRYANDYRRVLTCWKEGWQQPKITAATGLSKSLVNEYLDLIENHKHG